MGQEFPLEQVHSREGLRLAQPMRTLFRIVSTCCLLLLLFRRMLGLEILHHSHEAFGQDDVVLFQGLNHRMLGLKP